MRFFFILAILCGTLLLPAEEPGQQEYRLGLNLFEGLNGSVQDREAAFPFFKQAAARGNADAQYRLGHCYEFGFGTPKEPAKAREAYEQRSSASGTVIMSVWEPRRITPGRSNASAKPRNKATPTR